MVLRSTVVALLLAGSVLAQVPPPNPAPATPAKPAQDPDKQQPKTPADRIAELTAEKERLLREIGYVQERTKNQKQILSSKLAGTKPAFRSIDAGTNRPAPIATPGVTGPAPAPGRIARIATAEELAPFGNDTLVMVNGRPITQGRFDELMQFLAEAPGPKDAAAQAQRAMYELLRIEAVASAFADSEADERMREVEAQLAAGKSMTELAQTIGSIPGSQPNGQVDVSYNSAFGLWFEMVAFRTPVGQRSRPFRHMNGFVVMQVDSETKGAPPEPDRRKCTVVMLPYTTDNAALQKAHYAINSAQIDILARDQRSFEMLPNFFTRRPTPAGAAVDFDPAEARGLIAQHESDIAKLLAGSDPDAKAKAAAMQKHVDYLKQLLKDHEAGAKPIKEEKKEESKEEKKD
jgi:hypothetical protein